ncbi:YdcH family protein [Chitinimonas sp.]|uniref:YdcH family protein n=1 Tax=Chitinimonas sp. TaxID=1934313 RepID=UPI0035B2DDB6
MHIEHHPIAGEFPEFRDAIHALKMGNAHFKRLMDDYELVDKAITRVENGEERLDDMALETMKKQRLALKDNIQVMLNEAKATV